MRKKDSPAGDKKKKPAALKLLGALVCLGLAAGGGFVLAGRLAEKTAAAENGGLPVETTVAEPQPGCATPPEEPGPPAAVDLPPLSVNLADGHYLRVALSLALCDGVVLEAASKDDSGLVTAPAQDIALAALSGRPMAELATAQGRNEVKESLREQIMEAYPGVVADVFLIEFVMQ